MKYNNNIPQIKNIGLQNNFHHTNKIGLAKAYQSNKSTYVDGDTMYTAGTRTAKDWYDNFTKLVFNLTKNADRYKDAENALRSNPQVKNLVAHSLGSSVAVELTKRNEYKNSSPFIDSGSKTHGNRYRHSWDAISMLDRGAKSVNIGLVDPLKSHSYDNY